MEKKGLQDEEEGKRRHRWPDDSKCRIRPDTWCSSLFLSSPHFHRSTIYFCVCAFRLFFSLFLSRKKVKKPFPLRQINSKLHFGEAKRLRNTTNAHSSLVQFCLLLLSFPLFFVSSSIYVRCGFAQVDFVQPMSALRRRLSLCYLAILVGAKTERTKQRVTHSLSWPKKVLVVFAEVVFLPFSDSLTFANGRNEEKAQQS